MWVGERRKHWEGRGSERGTWGVGGGRNVRGEHRGKENVGKG